MQVQVLYYLAEALMLAVVYWLGVAAGVKALAAYGANVRFHAVRTFLLLWALIFCIEMVLHVFYGPECLAPFHVGLNVLIAGVAFRVYAAVFGPRVQSR